MPGLPELRSRLREMLEEIADDALSVYETVPESAPNLPAIVIQPATAQYEDKTNPMGLDTYEFDLQVIVSWGDSAVAQDALDAYLAKTGPLSIRALFRARRDMDFGDGTDARVDRMEYGVTFGREQELTSLGASLRLIVRTDG